MLDAEGGEIVRFKGIRGGTSYQVIRSLLAGASSETYTEGDAVTAVRRILNEGPQCEQIAKVPDEGPERRIFHPVGGDGFLKAREGEKRVRLNMSSRRLVDPNELELPGEIKITTVPWGYLANS